MGDVLNPVEIRGLIWGQALNSPSLHQPPASREMQKQSRMVFLLCKNSQYLLSHVSTFLAKKIFDRWSWQRNRTEKCSRNGWFWPGCRFPHWPCRSGPRRLLLKCFYWNSCFLWPSLIRFAGFISYLNERLLWAPKGDPSHRASEAWEFCVSVFRKQPLNNPVTWCGSRQQRCF